MGNSGGLSTQMKSVVWRSFVTVEQSPVLLSRFRRVTVEELGGEWNAASEDVESCLNGFK